MCDKENTTKHEEPKKRRLDVSNTLDASIEHVQDKQTENQADDQDQLAMVGSSNRETSSNIFQMDVKCFTELFEWLSVVDLLALRLTCNRFKEIINHFINSNYPEFVKFKVKDKNFDMIRQMNASTVGMVNEMIVSVGHDFDCTQFMLIKNLLNNVEKISIKSWPTIANDFYNSFLKFCNNVTRLTIKRWDNWDPKININNVWLRHKYPSLEYICLEDIPKEEIDDFVQFFRLNPNIRVLSVDLETLAEIGSHLVTAGIKFDQLYIHLDSFEATSLELLKNLHNNGFYKRLHLSFEEMELDAEEDLNGLALIGTEVLCSDYLGLIIPSSLSSLRELKFNERCEYDEHYENVRHFIERLNCGTLFPEDVLSYSRNCPNLKHLKIHYLYDTYKFDLYELNEERKRLIGACKTTIYVDEATFLTIKWATSKTDYDLVELKRLQACDWDQLFENDF